jgi:hypothetical protein
MNLDYSRIAPVIDVELMLQKKIVIVGVGGGHDLICDLVRCGCRKVVAFDFDVVEPVNIPRQGHMADQLGVLKVDAVARDILRIDPEANVTPVAADFCALTDPQVDEYIGDADLLIMATDSFHAQARGNEVALRKSIPAIWIGLYEGGQAAELCFWHPELDCCLRCIVSGRYSAYANGTAAPVTSRGASIFDVHIPDSIAGMLAVGLLTRGADNRFGKLIDQLGDRNFLQIKLDPSFAWNGRDIFREQLSIPDDCDRYFSFVTIARRDPDRGQLPCPDCERFRGHRFEQTAEGYRRIKPGFQATRIPRP